ncbi:MAG: UDP-2,3-diacylglucosamine diphosphatase LpxI [Clostridiaceae bacterium]|jgi:UDP-2,3-diacylglucosamine hydrolase|nr:UDP-2,3-diacylglucosamine diphosphatase LpxI [Clostridiaceae bacterium]
MLEHKQGLIAGDGCLPVQMAQYAKENGFEVVCISLSRDNVRDLKKYCSKVYSCHPGEVNRIEKIFKEEEIKQLTFLGKVHKRVLLQLHKFDKRAIELIKASARLNDDEVMLLIVKEFEKIGVTVLDQTIFIKNLMVPAGVLGKIKPTKAQLEDVNYGFWLAKEMGKVDVGQSVVIKDKMVMAVEAIEGTDKCIVRGAKFAKKDAVVVKVSKPAQDKRFDIPAIGLKTLKTMHRHHANLIAVEANETIIVNPEQVIKYANDNNIVIMAV